MKKDFEWHKSYSKLLAKVSDSRCKGARLYTSYHFKR